MPPLMIACTRCSESLSPSNGSWAFVYTQILIHVQACSPGIGPADLTAIASNLADEVEASDFSRWCAEEMALR